MQAFKIAEGVLQGNDVGSSFLSLPPVKLEFSPNGQWLASAFADGAVKQWDLKARQEFRSLNGHADAAGSICFSPDGARSLSSGYDVVAILWDMTTGRTLATYQELLTLRSHKDEVWSVAFSPDGKVLASGSWDRTVRLWHANR